MSLRKAETTTAAAELERVRQVEAETQAALEDERARLTAAKLRLAEADALATAVALGEADGDGVARARAGALDEQQRAEQELHRLEAVLEGLPPRVREAERVVAEEQLAELAERRADLERQRAPLEREARAAVEAAVEAAAPLAAMRDELAGLERELERHAAELEVEAPAGVDEVEWRPDGLEVLTELLESRLRTPNADRARQAEASSAREAERRQQRITAAARAVAAGATSELDRLPADLRPAVLAKVEELRAWARRFQPPLAADPHAVPAMLAAEPGGASVSERGEEERARLAAGAEAFREHRADLERRRERLAAERGGQVAGP